MLEFFHTLSGLTFVLFLLIKIVLHVHIDRRHGRIIDLPTMLIALPLFFKSYRSEVQPSFISIRRYCNGLLWLSWASLLLNFCIGVLMLF